MTISFEAKKDIIKGAVILVAFYFIINNPIAHPQPQATPGNWSIALMQHPLLLGIAGHNYLVLRDDTGAIKAELHGLATDESTGNWKYVGSRDTDTLKVWEFDGPRRYEANKKSPGIITFQGSQSETALLWNKAQICKERINELHLKYPPFGVAMRGETENSNSVAYTLTKCMDLPTKGVGWFTPGNGRDLLDNR